MNGQVNFLLPALQEVSLWMRREKKETRRILKELFRPSCFGQDDTKISNCIDYYFKHSTPIKSVFPCKWYDSCLKAAIRRCSKKVWRKRQYAKKET